MSQQPEQQSHELHVFGNQTVNDYVVGGQGFMLDGELVPIDELRADEQRSYGDASIVHGALLGLLQGRAIPMPAAPTPYQPQIETQQYDTEYADATQTHQSAPQDQVYAPEYDTDQTTVYDQPAADLSEEAREAYMREQGYAGHDSDPLGLFSGSQEPQHTPHDHDDRVDITDNNRAAENGQTAEPSTSRLRSVAKWSGIAGVVLATSYMGGNYVYNGTIPLNPERVLENYETVMSDPMGAAFHVTVRTFDPETIIKNIL